MRVSFGSRKASSWAKLARIIGVSLGALLFSAVASQAQTITLVEAYQRMMQTELEFQLLELEDDVAAELVRQARSQRLPRVTMTLEATTTRQNIISSDNTTFASGASQFPTTRINLTVTQPIFDQQRFRGVPLARAEQDLVSARAEVTRNDLAGQLLARFLDVGAAQIALDRANVLVRARAQLQSILSLQVSAGRADADLLLRAEGDTFQARSDVADAEAGVSAALFELYRFTGPEVTAVAVNSARLSLTDLRDIVQTFTPERLAQLSPQIQAAVAEVTVAERQVNRVRGALRPTAGLTLDVTKEQTSGSLFGGGSDVLTAELGLSINYTAYEGGLARSQVREAEARLDIAKLRLRQLQDLSNRRYDALLSALDRSNERARALGQQLRVANERLAAARDQEDAGRVGAEVVLESQLRRDSLALDVQLAQLRTVQIEAELFSLFGALDIAALSGQFSG